uniref:Expressed protein n=1 Tax=Echinococcus granulosus TaxID=6210 RepID=A0A068WDV8_ECHGR|nr:expressed protein [Echinococcus granulosus]
MHKTTSGLPILSRIKFNLCIFSANLAKIEITRPDSASAVTQEAAIGQATSGGLYTAIWRSTGCVRP